MKLPDIAKNCKNKLQKIELNKITFCLVDEITRNCKKINVNN